jgi:hypothetical protein
LLPLELRQQLRQEGCRCERKTILSDIDRSLCAGPSEPGSHSA